MALSPDPGCPFGRHAFTMTPLARASTPPLPEPLTASRLGSISMPWPFSVSSRPSSLLPDVDTLPSTCSASVPPPVSLICTPLAPTEPLATTPSSVTSRRPAPVSSTNTFEPSLAPLVRTLTSLTSRLAPALFSMMRTLLSVAPPLPLSLATTSCRTTSATTGKTRSPLDSMNTPRLSFELAVTSSRPTTNDKSLFMSTWMPSNVLPFVVTCSMTAVKKWTSSALPSISMPWPVLPLATVFLIVTITSSSSSSAATSSSSMPVPPLLLAVVSVIVTATSPASLMSAASRKKPCAVLSEKLLSSTVYTRLEPAAASGVSAFTPAAPLPVATTFLNVTS
mmetsp:Transcript_3476/g.8302  ORF Transcript_3476/g.8302 Transcript_3476/m.8302 type:complete len:337 (+) Transcript_3476:50-1060(+)